MALERLFQQEFPISTKKEYKTELILNVRQTIATRIYQFQIKRSKKYIYDENLTQHKLFQQEYTNSN